MATYFDGSNSEIQSSPPSSDGLQTLYLMNPNFHAPYSHAPQQHPTAPNNMPLLTPNAHQPHALNLANFSHAPSPNQHHFLHGVTNILGSTTSDQHSRPTLFGHPEITTAFHGFPTAAASAPRVPYNLWGSVVNNEPRPSTPSSSSGAAAVAADISFRRPSQQGLSLSLSSQQQQTGSNYRHLSGEVAGGVGNSPSSVSSVQGIILGSKYSKATQELLDEVVNVGSYKDELAEKVKKGNRESTSGIGEGAVGSSGGGGEKGGDVGKHFAELSTVQRQELQMKKSKLVTMLDEVEQRYRQYHHQMQVVISSFEQTAGFGAAKSYTSLALKTISKQFRCLKDAISWQIKAASKALGEDDCLGVKVEGSRLRYVDHHLRQQRALQQLGMIQPNAWRPQRGLPERAVSILRAWLFEHFLHPYPKDSDKVMLAKQTGLTRSQVSNWFINARVRLWKPMVEEMYLEETKEQQEHNNNNINGSEDNNIIIRSKDQSSKEFGSTSNNTVPESSSNILLQSKQQECFKNSPTTEISANSSIMSASPMGAAGSHNGSFHHDIMQIRTSPSRIIATSEMLSTDHMEMKHNTNNNNREEANNNTKLFGINNTNHVVGGGNSSSRHLLSNQSNNTNHGGGYGGFSMEDINGSRFNFSDHHQLASRFAGNGVSLTLGLPHNNNENLHISGTQQHHGFLSPENMHSLGRRLEINGNNNNGNEFCVINTTPPPQSSHAGAGNYESSIDIQNRKRFAAQLLPDFVA